MSVENRASQLEALNHIETPPIWGKHAVALLYCSFASVRLFLLRRNGREKVMVIVERLSHLVIPGDLIIVQKIIITEDTAIERTREARDRCHRRSDKPELV
jgi:hypothetical protein